MGRANAILAFCCDSAIPNMNALKITNSRDYKLHFRLNFCVKIATFLGKALAISWFFLFAIKENEKGKATQFTMIFTILSTL